MEMKLQVKIFSKWNREQGKSITPTPRAVQGTLFTHVEKVDQAIKKSCETLLFLYALLIC